MMPIFHIATQAQWQQAQQAASYRAESLNTEGFMHCSTMDQILWVANTFYRGQSGLVLFCIDPERVQAEIRHEVVTGVPVNPRFPHIYGALNLDAIVEVVPFEPDDEGQFSLPSGFSHSVDNT